MENKDHQLIEFNVTDAAIQELATQYLPLKIDGLEDKQGQKAVKEARSIVKRYRIDIDKKRKDLNADALEWQRKINAEAKRITLLLEPIESHLVAEEKRIDDEIERLKREKEEAEAVRYHERVTKLIAINFSFDGIKFKSNYLDTFNDAPIEIAVLHLKQMDETPFNEFFENAKSYFEIEQKRKMEELRLDQERRLQEEAERKANAEKLEQERKQIEAERLRLEAIAKEQAEKEAALKAEQEKIEKDKAQLNSATHVTPELKGKETDFSFDGEKFVKCEETRNPISNEDLKKVIKTCETELNRAFGVSPEPEFAEVEEDIQNHHPIKKRYPHRNQLHKQLISAIKQRSN